MESRIYVIVVTYNAKPWIEKCLGSVINSTLPANIIVVDNFSKDNTVDYIRERYPQVILFPQQENLGFGLANNLGMQYALDHGAEYIYLLNQDAWFEQDTLEKLIGVMGRNPEYGVVSPLQITRTGDSLDRNFCRAIFRSEITGSRLLSDMCLGVDKDVYPTPFFQAAHWLISSSCIDKVGLFSPIFKHYGEDNNYLKRVHYHGFETGIVTSTKAVHDRENRKNDNLASDAYFFLQQHLNRIADVNVCGQKRIVATLEYVLLWFVYKIFIFLYFMLFSENRKYFKHMPWVTSISNDVKRNRLSYNVNQ